MDCNGSTTHVGRQVSGISQPQRMVAMMLQPLINYFIELTAKSYQLVGQVGLSSDPAPLGQLLPELSARLEALKGRTIASYEALKRPAPLVSTHEMGLGVGLNTVGMLADRLTILIIKEWCLRNKGTPNPAKADELYQTHTLDVIHALAQARPGSSATNTKITRHTANASAECWEEAFFGLLSTNTLMWESQEVLYVKDITTLPYEELRDYMSWFSFSNIQRNEFIQLCEIHYWRHAR